jgi:predicted secreted protein
MSSTAQTAQGTIVAIDTGTSGTPVFTTIVNISDISGFDGKAAEIDVTDLSSTAKERRLGLQDWGQLTLTANINLGEASHAALLAAKKAGVEKSFKVTLSDGTVIAFSAFVASFPIAAKVDAVYTGAIGLTITGDITITPAG